MSRAKQVNKRSTSTKVAAPTINGKKVTVVEKTVVVLAQLRKVGNETPTRDLVMKMCGFTKPSSFNVTVGKEARKKNALVELPDSKTISLTPAGIEAAAEIGDMGEDTITTDENLRRYMKKIFKIGGNAEKMFDFLCENGPATNEELAKACGRDKPNASHNVQRGTLVRTGLVEKKGSGLFCLSSMCSLSN